MDATELRACPFCGHQSPELVGRGGYWWVVCVCGMETKKSNSPDAKDVQARRWNRTPKNNATLETIGQLAIDERLAQISFKSACDRYDKETLSGLENPKSYDPERLALLAASEALRKACDALI